MSQLEEDAFETRADDAWGNRFRVSCEDDQIVAGSAGPDARPTTPTTFAFRTEQYFAWAPSAWLAPRRAVTEPVKS